MQAIIRPKYLQQLKCRCIESIVRQCHGNPFIVVLFFMISTCCSCVVCGKFIINIVHIYIYYLKKKRKEKNGSTEHSKGNKAGPEKVATTRTEDG